VVLFNSTDAPAVISTTAAQLGIKKANAYTLNDLWANTASETAGNISANVPAHGSVMYRVSRGSSSAKTAPQVLVQISGADGSLTTGQTVPVTVSLTNEGRTAIKEADLSLSAPSGWTIKAPKASLVGKIGTDQTAKVKFRVTVGTPDAPLDGSTLTATADYRWKSWQRSTSVDQAVTVATPVKAPNKTFSSATDATAQYGQVGDAFAIKGAGADLYGSNDNYSTIYQSGVVGKTSTIQTEITGQQSLSGYGKAGILVRNTMTDAGKAPEGVILFDSPTGGVQLEWNSNSDASIDSVTPANGVIPFTTPVYLKLVRSGTSYTGYYSTDDKTWTTVGTATVPGQADTQDAGMFVTSHSSGSTATVDFNGFTVDSGAAAS
jgi:alpha-galactosidase